MTGQIRFGCLTLSLAGGYGFVAPTRSVSAGVVFGGICDVSHSFVSSLKGDKQITQISWLKRQQLPRGGVFWRVVHISFE